MKEVEERKTGFFEATSVEMLAGEVIFGVILVSISMSVSITVLSGLMFLGGVGLLYKAVYTLWKRTE